MDALQRFGIRLLFLSTPSGWRATIAAIRFKSLASISIHALRVEGDRVGCRTVGNRHISIHALRVEGDLEDRGKYLVNRISIHALRVEGDGGSEEILDFRGYFYPRPPGGGRRLPVLALPNARKISIHALRVEGDPPVQAAPLCVPISIHALRVEGDSNGKSLLLRITISIHALRVEGDPRRHRALHRVTSDISIHALRVEGDTPACTISSRLLNFYPRPPGGGRQQKRTKFSSVFAQKGEEFASLRRGKRKICRWRFKKDKF